MGRAKIAMEFITKEKTRNTTYVKRKKGLLKKAHELSILCNVPVCIIIYPYKQGNHEVYSFKGDSSSNAMDLTRATDPMIAGEMIDRYLRTPNEEKYKRALNLYDMFDEWTKKADQELSKLRHKNAFVKYPSWDSRFDCLTLEQLMELLTHLDNKIEFVKQKISLAESNNHNHNHNHNHCHNHETAALVPYFEPTPISSHQVGFPYVEGYNNNNNQVNSYNYNPGQQFCHQLVPLNYPNLDNQGGSTSSSYQMGGTRMDDQGSSKGSNLMYNINMNSMAGMPLYYDQGRGFVDNIGLGATSLYGAGLTLPPLPNASLQTHRQYQMFYKQDGWMGDDQH